MFDWLYKTVGLAYREAWAVVGIFENIKKMFTGFSLKGFFSGIMAVIELFGMLLFGAPTTPRGQELSLDGYQLVFCDEFDGDSLNTDVWQYRGNGARRSGYNAPSQVEIKDGKMTITGEYLKDGEYGEGWYAGMVSLKEKYTRGYFEIRCICNKDTAFWSAFWIQASNPYDAKYSQGGIGGCEIDIFEAMSYDSAFPNSVTSTVHCAGVDGVQEGFQSAILGDFKGNNIYEEFNTYGLEWTEDEYIFYINGVETTRTSFGNGVSQVPEEIIVSLEIPGEDKLEKFDKETYNTEFIVDYVKIYQKP